MADDWIAYGRNGARERVREQLQCDDDKGREEAEEEGVAKACRIGGGCGGVGAERGRLRPPCSAHVMGLLEGTDAAPSETLEAEDENKKEVSVPNPAYDAWVTKDQQVVSFLINSLSEDVLPHVFGLHPVVDVWRALHNMYSTHSKSRVSTLRGALTNTKKLI
ncbi:hypothetical protein QYE76_016565 [Lolium multiflorum]|uniref:Uncharacterized protein n=1 Tax=Lolium multiflorum TaxID=4521 RepID=A0AAD8QLH5_LOLMU|nr:hypothetical protein QYE76_016565 [Lolium multiflorum]